MSRQYGINLEKKRALVEGRLGSAATLAGFATIHDYIEDILSDPLKINKLVASLTTNYTYFLREEHHFDFMTNTALPELSRKIKNYDLRTWSAGCSSGEEAYTAAMVIDDFFDTGKSAWDTTILATDISQQVLNTAKRGTYPADSIERLPEKWKLKYFRQSPSENEAIVSDNLKKEVVFATFNLMENFSRFRKRFHIIFCRNVMIYFDASTKAALIRRFYDVLEPGGYFFIGMSETLSGIDNSFRQIAPAIYRKG